MLSEINISIQEESFSNQLKSSTMKAHEAIERNEFINRIFKMQISRQEYALLVNGFKEVYKSMERAITRNFSDEDLYKFRFDKLKRVSRLEQDVSYWGEVPIISHRKLQIAVGDYLKKIENLSQKNPHLLWAHLYVRYFGDLSGGQMMAIFLAKNFGSDEGLSFYEFGDRYEIASLKQGFRTAIDQYGEMYKDFRNPIIEEANLVFKLNDDLYKAVSFEFGS
jgi:heme oxygenase